MGRREAGQHRPAPPHQPRQPPILCLEGTRVPQAKGYRPPAASPALERKPRSPALVTENTALATGGLVSWSHQHRRPPRPPPRALSGPLGSPARRPEAVPGGSALCLLPVGPSGSTGLVLLLFNTLQISSTEGTISCNPAGGADGRRWDAQENASRLCSALTEGSLFPAQRRAAVKGIPQAWPARRGWGARAPGAHAAWTLGLRGRQPGPSSWLCGRAPPPLPGGLVKPPIWDTLVPSLTPASYIPVCDFGKDACGVRPECGQLPASVWLAGPLGVATGPCGPGPPSPV